VRSLNRMLKAALAQAGMMFGASLPVSIEVT
jgi:hypothetical protein